MRFSSHLDGVMVLHLIPKVIGKGKMLDCLNSLLLKVEYF